MTDIRIRKGFSYVLDFIWDVSGCRGFLCWYKERKISREIKTLRNDGELDRVLKNHDMHTFTLVRSKVTLDITFTCEILIV